MRRGHRNAEENVGIDNGMETPKRKRGCRRRHRYIGKESVRIDNGIKISERKGRVSTTSSIYRKGKREYRHQRGKRKKQVSTRKRGSRARDTINQKRARTRWEGECLRKPVQWNLRRKKAKNKAPSTGTPLDDDSIAVTRMTYRCRAPRPSSWRWHREDSFPIYYHLLTCPESGLPLVPRDLSTTSWWRGIHQGLQYARDHPLHQSMGPDRSPATSLCEALPRVGAVSPRSNSAQGCPLSPRPHRTSLQ